MEREPKRLRFRDEDGREWDVDQLLSVPPHVAVQILINIDNILDLYNFANTSKRARSFMRANQVFQNGTKSGLVPMLVSESSLSTVWKILTFCSHSHETVGHSRCKTQRTCILRLD